MKIKYLSNSIIPSRQANTIHVMQMANAILSLGHDIRLYVWGNIKKDKSKDIKKQYGVNNSLKIQNYISFPRKRLSSLTTLINVVLLLSEKNDLIIGRNPKACGYTSFFGIPTLLELHQPISWYPKPEQFFIKLFLLGKGFRGLVAISDALKKILVHESGIGDDKILVAHDAATSPPHTNIVYTYKERLKIGYVGHLYKGRGIDLIIELSKLIKCHDFHIVGGTEEDILYWRAHNTGNENLFIHGYIPPSEVTGFQQSCDILLAPYQKNVSIPGSKDTSLFMSPLKIFEYMSSGIPFIVSNLPILHEVLVDQQNCLMSDPDSIDNWIMAITQLEDPLLREKIALSARNDFNKNHTWRTRANTLIEFTKKYA